MGTPVIIPANELKAFLGNHQANPHGWLGMHPVTHKRKKGVVARAFVVSLGPMLLLVGSLGVGLWIAALFSQRRQGGWARWLWPHGGLAPMYKVMAISVGCVLVGFVATTEALFGA